MPQQKILITLIEPNPYQPETRANISPEVAEQFGKSILENGMLQTPLVRPVDGHFQIADGHQRFAGVRWILDNPHVADDIKKGFRSVSCDVRELTDEQMADTVLEANTVRRDLTPIELAHLYKRFLEDFKMTQEQLAKKHNCSQGEIANTIRLLDLPEPIQVKVISREIGETQARQLLRINNEPEMQTRVAAACIKDALTVNQLDQHINRSIYQDSESLVPGSWNSPKFDVSICSDCVHKVLAHEPWGNSKKELRCLDKACWKKKEDAAIKEAVALAQKDIAKATGGKGKGAKVLTHKELAYGQYEELSRHMKNLDIDTPTECRVCERTALYKYDLTGPGEPERVCVDVACFRKKKSKHTREANKNAKELDVALTLKIGKALEHVGENPHNCMVVLARFVLSKLTSEQPGLDVLKMIEGLPKTPNGRLDTKALLETLEDRTLDDLFHLALAGSLTLERRAEYYYSTNGYNIRLTSALQREVAYLTGTMAQHRKDILAWREGNCVGCRYNNPDLMKEADKVNCTTARDVDIEARCPSQYIPKEEAAAVDALAAALKKKAQAKKRKAEVAAVGVGDVEKDN